MFIIFGTRGVTYKHKRGDFSCPSCRTKQAYVHKRQRRFFTLYFIPLIPLDLLGEFVECQGCRSTYTTKILSYDPEGEQRQVEAEYHRAIRQVLVQMMLADGVIDDKEVKTIQTVYQKLTGRELDKETYDATVREARVSDLTTLEGLKKMAGTLNDEGKERVIESAYRVAAADGNFDDAERQLLGAMGHALCMSPAHIRGVISGLDRRS